MEERMDKPEGMNPAVEAAAQDVEIHPGDLAGDAQRLPASIYRWGSEYARARQDQLQATLDREMADDQLRRVMEEIHNGSGERSELLVRREQVFLSVIDRRAREDAAEVEVMEIEAVLEALRAKRDMLTAFSKNAGPDDWRRRAPGSGV
jgi:hypothetical protein